MSAPLPAFAAIAASVSLVMVLAWAVTLRPGRSGWIDVVWSLATGVAGAVAALVPIDGQHGIAARQLLVGALAAVWAARLGLHIAGRTAPGHDDPRYAELRRQWGARFAARSFWFLQIQAVAAMLLAGVIALAAHNPAGGFRLLDAVGALIVLLGIGGEALADRQLRRFRSAVGSHGRVCDRGLWSVSRHPNYFGEWLVWVGFVLIAIGPFGAYPLGWLALSGPLLMYVLLVHASGIPPLEAHMLRTRGEAFRAYQARVNAFWPWPARRADLAAVAHPPSHWDTASSRGNRHEPD